MPQPAASLLLPLAQAAQALPWPQVRLGATLMLALYAVVAILVSRREFTFLASLKGAERRNFILLDLLIQVAVLLILLPCMLASAPSLNLFVVIFIGFVLLWVMVIWNGTARSMYTARLMLEFRTKMQMDRSLERVLKGAQAAEKDEDSPEGKDD